MEAPSYSRIAPTAPRRYAVQFTMDRVRDQDRCAWITEDGRRCEERRHLQFDHIQPLGKGGEWTTENVRLLCPAHNRLAAEQVYGEGHVHRSIERNRGTGAERRERGREGGHPVPVKETAPLAGAAPAVTPPPQPSAPG